MKDLWTYWPIDIGYRNIEYRGTLVVEYRNSGNKLIHDFGNKR